MPPKKLNAWAAFLQKYGGKGHSLKDLLKAYKNESPLPKKASPKKSSRKSRKPAAKKAVVAKSPAKKAASKKSSKRKLNAWAKFLKDNGGNGKPMPQLVKAYKAGSAKKSPAKKSSRKSRKPTANKSPANKSPAKKKSSSRKSKINPWVKYLKKHKGDGTMAQLAKAYNAGKK